MVLTRVVLPAPLAPSTAVMLPWGTDSVTLSSAMTPPYATVRSLISSMGDLLSEIRVGDVAVGADLVGGARRDHLAEVENGDGVAHGHHHIDVVLDEGDGHPRPQRAQHLDELVHIGGGEPTGWLIEAAT